MAGKPLRRALGLLIRARDGDGAMLSLMAECRAIAAAEGVTLGDLQRALDLCEMTPAEYFRHEQAVARILNATGAPVRARLIEMTTEPAFDQEAAQREARRAARWRAGVKATAE